MGTTEDIIYLFRQFKLGHSLFRTSTIISVAEQEYQNKSAIDHEAMRKAESQHRLADFIHSHMESATEKTVLENGDIEYNTTLLVLKLEDFKTILEAAISFLPYDKIKEIKEGKTYIS